MAIQAAALPDPVASVAFINEGLSSITLGESPMAQLIVGWTQEVPGSRKRRLAGDVARTESEVIALDAESLRRRVAAQVKAAYAELLRIDRTRRTLDASRSVLRSLMDVARARYESGDGALESVFKAETADAEIEAETQRLALERRQMEIGLAALLGRGEDSRFPPATRAPIGLAWSAAELERAALDGSSELRRLQAVTRKEELRLDLAQRSGKPDYVWGGSYGYRGSLEPMVEAAFGIRLPVYRSSKQAAAVDQAEREIEASRQDTAALGVRLRAEVRDLAARAELAASLDRLYQERLLPQARSALEAATAAHAVGRVDFSTLLEDTLAVLRYEQEAEALRADRIRWLAALEPLTGETLVVPGGPHD
jgi:cobalt-zinc-cadmium efflux system outer membrane protein